MWDQHNIEAVNEAFNELLIEEEDHATLRDSINSYDNFSQLELASRLEKHDLLEFRRIAALLYKKNSKWVESISLSKQDKLFKGSSYALIQCRSDNLLQMQRKRQQKAQR